MYYSILCEEGSFSFEKRRSVHKAHLQYLKTLKGHALLSGTLLGDDSDNPLVGGFKGTLMIAEFKDINEARAWIAQDPYVTAGIFNRILVYPFIRESYYE